MVWRDVGGCVFRGRGVLTVACVWMWLGVKVCGVCDVGAVVGQGGDLVVMHGC